MRPVLLFLAATLLMALLIHGCAPDRTTTSFSPYVDGEGTISLPRDYRSWAFLGTWSIADEEGADASELHNVYTQPEALAAYRETGRFPDGAVLVKELLEVETAELSTGRASWGQELNGWFIMVKDEAGRFPGHALWGDGWGWALIFADDPQMVVTGDYKSECLECHQPAEEDDWVFLRGYPALSE